MVEVFRQGAAGRGLVLLAACISACASPAYLTKSELSSARELAREKVLNSGVLKGKEEVETVKSTDPKVTYYFLAKPYADYQFAWSLNGSERVVVHGRGNLLLLEAAVVQRFPKIP